jgi:predicted AAA+ superfamily ATPase
MFNRTLKSRLLRKAQWKQGHLLVLTGARQAGKTALVREVFPDMPYVSLEDPVARPAWSQLSAADWVERYPRAILDEIQKAPDIIDTVRSAHGQSASSQYLMLGSSQVLLRSGIKENQAGHDEIEELWPLTLPEIAADSRADSVPESRFIRWVRSALEDDGVLLGNPNTSRSFSRHKEAFDRYLKHGGMPAVHNPALSDEQREQLLRDYQRIYLERDLADIAALRSLQSFVVAQKAVALRTGQTVNFADLARDASISAGTARRFLHYLEQSYQVLLLRPYHRHPRKRLVRMPKVHFIDPGIQRITINRRGPLTAPEFESAVVAEIVKQTRNAGLMPDLYHLRTHDGREVDLLAELETGFVAIKIKSSPHVSRADTRHFRDLQQFLDKPLLKALVFSMDNEIAEIADGVLALPAAWALGCEK